MKRELVSSPGLARRRPSDGVFSKVGIGRGRGRGGKVRMQGDWRVREQGRVTSSPLGEQRGRGSRPARAKPKSSPGQGVHQALDSDRIPFRANLSSTNHNHSSRLTFSSQSTELTRTLSSGGLLIGMDGTAYASVSPKSSSNGSTAHREPLQSTSAPVNHQRHNQGDLIQLANKSCTRCRERRVRCNREWPNCDRCLKRKEDCDWGPNISIETRERDAVPEATKIQQLEAQLGN